MRRLVALAGLASLPALGALAGLAGATSAGIPARLQGRFAVSGRVTSAVNVPGEHAGQRLSRTFLFTSPCPSGPCAQIVLVRGRGPGLRRVSAKLTVRTPGYYVGGGAFYAPLRCAGRTYRPGERVHYRIAVRITAASTVAGQLVATAMRASYASGTRDNLTPCVEVVGQRDAANYQGSLIP